MTGEKVGLRRAVFLRPSVIPATVPSTMLLAGLTLIAAALAAVASRRMLAHARGLEDVTCDWYVFGSTIVNQPKAL